MPPPDGAAAGTKQQEARRLVTGVSRDPVLTRREWALRVIPDEARRLVTGSAETLYSHVESGHSE